MRKKRILLRLVEAMDLVHEENRRAPRLRKHRPRAGDRIADLLHPGQHGGDGDELGVAGTSEQARERGLAHTRRPPQDHGVQLARLDREAQRLARPQQVLLPNHILDALRSQLLRERRFRRDRREKVGHEWVRGKG